MLPTNDEDTYEQVNSTLFYFVAFFVIRNGVSAERSGRWFDGTGSEQNEWETKNVKTNRIQQERNK